jgi:uncharacterized protein
MDPRVSLVTLGVSDLPRAKAFYDAWGWKAASDLEDVVFYPSGGGVLALWSRVSLAADGEVADPGGWGGITLSMNLASPEEVDRVIEDARAAGATVARPGTSTEWGGYAGVIHDPDGHVWEIAHNPGWPMDADGTIRLPS